MSKVAIKSPGLSKFQKFEALEIKREQIKNAPYNPREISDESAKELRKALKKFGLVETLVWNKRTGNLVGGHQRLAQLDALEGSNKYSLTISVIDVDLKSEKEINLLLNNPNLQGTYDQDALAKLVGEIDFKNAGFTEADLDVLGINVDLKEIEKAEIQDSRTVAEKIQAIKDVKKASKEKSRTQTEEYIVVTFSDPEARVKLLDLFDLSPDDRYIKGETLLSLVLKNK